MPRGEAPGQVCRDSTICALDRSPEQRLRAVSSSCSPTWCFVSGERGLESREDFPLFRSISPPSIPPLFLSFKAFPCRCTLRLSRSLLLPLASQGSHMISICTFDFDRTWIKQTGHSVQMKRSAVLIVPTARRAIRPPPSLILSLYFSFSPSLSLTRIHPRSVYLIVRISPHFLLSSVCHLHFCFMQDRGKNVSCFSFRSPRTTRALLIHGP